MDTLSDIRQLRTKSLLQTACFSDLSTHFSNEHKKALRTKCNWRAPYKEFYIYRVSWKQEGRDVKVYKQRYIPQETHKHLLVFQIPDKSNGSATVTGKKGQSWGSAEYFIQNESPLYGNSPQSSIYSLTLRSESRVAGFCMRSVRGTDGNNLAFASNPEDGCFYSLDFLWCQRRPCSPESLPADCSCCQCFITFCISGFLIANWNILDSWAQERFPSCFLLPPRKGPGSPFHSPEIWSCSFPECVQINPNVIGFYLQTAFLPWLLGQCSHTLL